MNIVTYKNDASISFIKLAFKINSYIRKFYHFPVIYNHIFRQIMSSEYLIISLLDGKICGYACFTTSDIFLDIDDIFSVDDNKNPNIISELLSGIIKIANDLNISIKIDVLNANKNVTKKLECTGFEKVVSFSSPLHSTYILQTAKINKII